MRPSKDRSNRRGKWDVIARKLWPRSVWQNGSGPFALVAHCRGVSVWLYETMEEAQRFKAIIDKTQCGGECRRVHQIHDLREPVWVGGELR